MNLVRIWTIATNCFREVIRDRILYLIALFALLMITAWQLLPQITASTQDKILLDFGLASASIMGVIVAIFVGTGLINKEIEKRTVLILIPKPVSYAEFIIGKHLGLSGVLGVLVAAMTAIYLAILTLSHISYPLGSILLSEIYLFFELSLMTAVALMFGVFTSSILATLLSIIIYLAGHLSEDMIKLGSLTKNPGLEKVFQGLFWILPDLSRLNLKNEAVYGIIPPELTLLGNAAYAVVYTLLLLAIATLIFSRREF